MNTHLIANASSHNRNRDAHAACDHRVRDKAKLVEHVGGVTCERCLKLIRRLYSGRLAKPASA